jgi:hypothetical protein
MNLWQRRPVTRFGLIFAALIAFAAALPVQGRAQTPAPTPQDTQPSDDEVGNVASVQGNATATRNGASRRLKVQDPIFKGDLLRTAAASALGITFDDETTFNLSANANITVDEFIYEEGGKSNSALFKIARGTVAFAAHQVAKTGDMKIETPSSTLGIRGTSGVVEVPEGATPGTTGEVAVKLYADQDGRVGRIELFGAGGGPQLGLLTRAATGFSLRGGPGGRFAAVALTISPQQIARDRGFVQRAFAARSIGRTMIDRRRNLRSPGLQRQPGGLRQPNNRQQNLRQPNGPQQNLRQPTAPRPGTLPAGQRANQPQTAPRVQGPAGARTAPNIQQQNLQRQNLQQQNLQRQNLQQQNLQRQNLRQRPATPAPRQPARRKPNEPPPR